MATNFSACNDYRRLLKEHGPLVPESKAHVFAGVSRKRWWEIRYSGKVPVVTVLHLAFVPLSWLEARKALPGRRGILSKLRRGEIPPCPSDFPYRPKN